MKTSSEISKARALVKEGNPEGRERLFALAEAGDAEAMYEIALCFKYEPGFCKENENGLSLFSQWRFRAAEAGYAWAQYCIAEECHEEPDDWEDDFAYNQRMENVIEWYTRAAQNGLAEAQFRLAECFFEDEWPDMGREKAVEWLQLSAAQGYRPAIDLLDQLQGFKEQIKRAEEGDVTAQFELASRYNEGIRIPRDYEKAAYWWERAAEQGHIKAMLRIARCYERGNGVQTSPERAAEWWKRAALLGDWHGLADYIFCVLRGYGVPQDVAQGLSLYEEAAGAGYAFAAVALGYMYRDGDLVERSLPLAVHWFRIAKELKSSAGESAYEDIMQLCTVIYAAHRGKAEAQARLAKAYEYKGTGVPRSYDRSLYWYLRAAKQGHRGAQSRLAEKYRYGRDGNGKVDADIQSAIYWYERAAEGGDHKAMYDLGCIYRWGRGGVDIDLTKAEYWYKLAEEKGNAQAKRMLTQMQNEQKAAKRRKKK